MKKYKDFKEYREHMYDVPKEDEFWVKESRGHSRAIFNFHGCRAFYEQIIPFNPLKEPNEFWWTDMEIPGKVLATKIAEWYGGEIEESFYGPEDHWHFVFDEFEKMLLMFYHVYTNEFHNKWEKELNK